MRISKAFNKQQQSRDFYEECEYPIIICGDMNSAFSYVLKYVIWTKIVLKKRFGATYKFKYPTRIDYIFLMRRWLSKNVWKLSWIWKFDHYPIMYKK
jgi:hypothetical protein